MLTASSGALVPNATIVSPTNSGEMPQRTANLLLPLSIISAPTPSMMKPQSTKNVGTSTVPPGTFSYQSSLSIYWLSLFVGFLVATDIESSLEVPTTTV